MSEFQTEIIDSKKLEQLHNWQGRPNPGLFRKVINLFLEQMASLLYQILQAAKQGDSVNVLEIAHTLKSSSGTVGAIYLMELCQQIEKSCAQEFIDQDLIARLQPACADVELALKKELDAVG